MVAIIPSLMKIGIGKKMTKLLAIAFINTTLLVSLSGCGYKAPPFYEKQTNEKGSTVAL